MKNQTIKKIQKHFNSKEKFTFCDFQQGEVIKIIKELPKNKANTFKDIPLKIMVNSFHRYSHSLTKIFYECVKGGHYYDTLKYADITPVFKKGNTADKSN